MVLAPRALLRIPDQIGARDVVAMPDSDSGHWWFWFTWAERIALVENLGVAAEIIVGVLRQPVSLAAASSSPSSPGSYRYAS